MIVLPFCFIYLRYKSNGHIILFYLIITLMSCLLTYTCLQARQQWKLLDIVIQHKLGACPIKHVSIAIVISSEHRKDSLEAVSFVIDELKKTVPIWKRVSYAVLLFIRLLEGTG